MPRDIRNLEDELPREIGIDSLLKAIAYTSRTTTPVSNIVPGHIGEMVFVSTTKQFFIAVGTLNTDWQAINAAT